MQSALVTGGAGFIGSHLVRRLSSLNSQVAVMDPKVENAARLDGVDYICGALSREILETVDFVPTTIFHLAGGASVAESIADPEGDFVRSVYASFVLLEFLRRRWPQTRVVFISSAAIYGESKEKRASHDLTCLPLSPYGVHKRMVEALLFDYARMYGIRSVIVRPFSVYGPGLRKQLLWDALEKASRGCFEFFGSGHELRDWVYVADLVECLLRASSRADVSVPIFNAGTCRAVSVHDVLTELFQIAGVPEAPRFVDRPKEGDPNSLVADDSAESALGPLFVTPLGDGLRAYVEWYRCSKNPSTEVGEYARHV